MASGGLAPDRNMLLSSRLLQNRTDDFGFVSLLVQNFRSRYAAHHSFWNLVLLQTDAIIALRCIG